MSIRLVKLPARTMFYGWCYKKDIQLRMTGKEWHEYAKRSEFKVEHGGDSAFGGNCEIWLDGKNLDGKK